MARRIRRSPEFVQQPLFDVTVRTERRYYRQMLDALVRSDFGTDQLEAEITVSKLFGTVWAAQPAPRDGSVEEAFGLGLVDYVAQQANPTAVGLLSTVAQIAPVREVRAAAAVGASALIARGLPRPQWSPSFEPGTCWAYEDVFGDQMTVVTAFRHNASEPAMIIEIDSALSGAAVNAGLAVDASDQVRDLRLRATASGGMFVLRQLDPGLTRALLARAVSRTDLVELREVWPGLVDLRAFVLARAGALPEGPDLLSLALDAPALGPAGQAAMVTEFLASPEGRALLDTEVAASVAEQVVAYASNRDPSQVARVSPARWEDFLHAWWPTRTVPGDWRPVVRAWSAWAARRMSLPEVARVELAGELEEMLADD